MKKCGSSESAAGCLGLPIPVALSLILALLVSSPSLPFEALRPSPRETARATGPATGGGGHRSALGVLSHAAGPHAGFGPEAVPFRPPVSDSAEFRPCPPALWDTTSHKDRAEWCSRAGGRALPSRRPFLRPSDSTTSSKFSVTDSDRPPDSKPSVHSVTTAGACASRVRVSVPPLPRVLCAAEADLPWAGRRRRRLSWWGPAASEASAAAAIRRSRLPRAPPQPPAARAVAAALRGHGSQACCRRRSAGKALPRPCLPPAGSLRPFW